MIKKFLKIRYLELVPMIIITILLYKILNNFSVVGGFISYLYSVFSYLVWGFVIAYLLNPLLNILEKRFKLHRALSLLIVYLCVVLAIFFAITIFTPKLIKSISELVEDIPSFIVKAQDWFDKNIESLQAKDLITYVEQNLNDIAIQAKDILEFVLNFVYKKMMSVTMVVVNLVLGIIVSIYVLNEKEALKKSLRGFLYAYFEKSHADFMIKAMHVTDRIFSKFIIGKILDSIIVSIICFIGLAIFEVPFATLISFILGITHLIPYIGAIFGIIPAVIITIFSCSPIAAAWVAVFIIVIQQFDSWVISPKILGDKTGLSPLWIIIALVIGGGTYGVVGLFVSIPVIAVIKYFLVENIEKRLTEKNI